MREKWQKLDEMKLLKLPKTNLFENPPSEVRSKSILSSKVSKKSFHTRHSSIPEIRSESHYSMFNGMRLDFAKLKKCHNLSKILQMLKRNRVDDFAIIALWYETIKN
jgi:hypothetical protein